MLPPSPAGSARTVGLAVVLTLVAFSLSPGTRAAMGATASTWAWPVGPPHQVVGPYLAPPTPFGSGHRGIDIAGAPHASVIAPADGIVHYAGWVVDRPVLSLRHAGGLISSFEPVTTTLTAGEQVSRGDTVAKLLPGHCNSVCLHFGVRLHGDYVSPLKYLGGIPRSVLLPTRPLP